MPPKKASTASTKKAPAAAPAHASYQDMIKEAIINLKDRAGSSRQAIKKYVRANNNIDATDGQFNTQVNRALQKGSDSGVFSRPKGPSGPVKLAAPAAKTAKPVAKTTKAPVKAKPTKTASSTKQTTTKKSTTPKAATKKTPAKKTATKAKANTGKARKTPSAAPAVEEKASVVLGKTKSGRVTKSNAPQPDKGIVKQKAPAKKATQKKAAAPVKAA